MSEGLQRFIRESLTDESNVTWDAFRILAVASILVGFVLQAASVAQGKPFDMQAFGIGIGSLLAGVGVALRLNKEDPK